MGDMGDDFREWRDHKQEQKRKHGVPCPDCMVNLPKAQPKILMPGQKCWCGYVDKRQRRKQ